MVADLFRPASWLVAFALVAVVPGSVHAQDDIVAAAADNPIAPQRVYIIASPTDDSLGGVSARVGAAARSALRSIEGALWEEADSRFMGYDSQTLQHLNLARTRLSEGRQAYLNLELESAIDLLGQAVADFDLAAAALEDPTELGEALLFLGASYTFQGQNRPARRAFSRLHRQFPHVDPDPNIFPPDVIDRYNGAAPRDRNNPRGTVLIESEPAGAVAYVDYVARGTTPLTVEGLMTGNHVVRVTRPGAVPFVLPSDVRNRDTDGVNAFLEDNAERDGLADAVLAARAANLDRIENGSPLGEIAVQLDLDKLGVVRVSAGDSPDTVHLELSVFDVTDGRRVLRGQGPAPVAMGELEDAVTRLVEGAMQVALRPQQVEVEPDVTPTLIPTETTEPEGDPIFTKWWFWTAIGGAVVLAAIVTIAVTVPGESLPNDTTGRVLIEF